MGTQTISVSKLRGNLAEALDSVNSENMLIIKRRGKAERAIIDIDKLEDLLASSNPDYLDSIRRAREDNQIFTHDDVFGDI